MAENGNRGPNEAYRRQPGGRKRREPPIIDAQAAEVPAEPDTVAGPITPEAVSAGPDPRPADSTSTEPAFGPHAEPVLFGTAAPETAMGREQTPPASKNDKADAALEWPPEFHLESPSTPDATDPTGADAASKDRGSASVAEPLPLPGRSHWSALSILLALLVLGLLGSIAALIYTEPQRSRSGEFAASLEAVRDRMAALESAPASNEAAPASNEASTAIAAADQRAGALESQLALLRANVADLGTRLDSVAAEATTASSRVAALAETASSTASSTPFAQSSELPALSNKLDELSRRVASLQDQPQAAAQPGVDLGPVEGRIAALDHRLTDLDHRIEVLGGEVTDLPKIDIGPVQASLARVEQRLAPLEATVAAPKAGERVTEARAVGSADAARAAPVAVVAQAVDQALAGGRPFGTEVAALRALGVEDASLAPLSRFADKGAPTLEALRQRWKGLQDEVLAADRPEKRGGVLDRLAAGARGLVEVRRVDASPEQNAGSVADLVAAALDRDDLAGALAERAKIPEAGQRASQGWADDARAALDAQAAARRLLYGAIATLAKARD